MTTDAPSDTSKPAWFAPLTREFAEPSASVTFAEAPGCTSKAQSSSPDSLTSTPASATSAFVPEGTTMRSRSVCATPSLMETDMGFPVRILSVELG